MSSKLTDCISYYTQGNKNQSFRKDLINKYSSILLSPASEQKAALQKHLKHLESTQSQIETYMKKTGQFSVTKDIFQTIKTTTKNLFNRAQKYLKPKADKTLTKSILHNSPDLVKTLLQVTKSTWKDFAKQNLPGNLDNDNSYTLVQKLRNYLPQMTQEINKIWKADSATLEGKISENNLLEPLLDFTDDKGHLPVNLVAAIASSMFKWTATKAEDIAFKSDDDIRNMFGLPENTAINPKLKQELGDLGIPQKVIIEQLGKTIYSLLGLDIIPEHAPMDYQQRVQTALGTLAVAALESTHTLRLQEIYTGRVHTYATADTTQEPISSNTREFGYNWLKKLGEYSSKVDKAPVFRKSHASNTRTLSNGKVELFEKAKYYTLGNSQQERIIGLRKVFQAAPRTWNALFNNHETTNYTWDKPEGKSKRKYQGTKQFATEKQNKNLDHYDKQPNAINLISLNILSMLSPDLLQKALGVKEITDTTHISNHKSITSKNNQIQRAWDAVQAWIQDAETQPAKLKSLFYVTSELMSQGRARINAGIDRQNNKIHRYLFTNPNMEATISLDTAEANSADRLAFLVAVGQSFEIGYSKEGTIETVIDKTREELNTTYAPVIELLTAFLEQQTDIHDANLETFKKLGETNTELTNALTEVLSKVDDPTALLQGLIEYSRYQLAIKQNAVSFKTNMTLETDGLSNGPMLLILNTLTGSYDIQTSLKILRNAGWVFHKNQKPVEELLQNRKYHDIYQNVSFHVQQRLNNLINTKGHNPVIQTITELVGSLADENGEVSKAMRKLAKKPAMTATFGAGKRNIVEAFVSVEIVQKQIYNKLQDIAEIFKTNPEQAKQEIDVLNAQVKILTGHNLFSTAKELTLERIVTRQLTPTEFETLNQNVNKDYGKALYEGVEDVYGASIAVRQKFNDSLLVITDIYNKLLIEKYERLQKENGDQPVTVAQFNKLQDELKSILPIMKTPFGGQLELTTTEDNFIADPLDPTNYVNMSFKSNGHYQVAQKRQLVGSIKQQAFPGVRAPILGIHNIDAAIANIVSGIQNILNIYDGFYAGIKDITQVSQAANEALYDISREYDLFNEMAIALDTNYTSAVQVYADTFGVSKEEAIKVLDQISNETQKTENPYQETYSSISELMDIIKNLGKDTKKAKNRVLKAVFSVNHYNMFGEDFQTGNKPLETLAGIRLDKMDATTLAHVENASNRHKLRSDARGDISLNPHDYELAEELNKETTMDIYNRIKNSGPEETRSSDSHDSYLQSILSNIIIKVLQPMNMFIGSQEDVETSGAFVPDPQNADSIFMMIQQMNNHTLPASQATSFGLRNAAGSTMVHELLHGITYAALKEDHTTRSRLMKLMKFTEQQLETQFNGQGWKVFLNDSDIDITDIANAEEVQAAQDRYNHIFHNADVRQVTHTNKSTGKVTIFKLNNGLAEFLAVGLSDEQFVTALQNMPITLKAKSFFKKESWTNVKQASIQGTLLNIFDRAMNLIKNNFMSKKLAPSAHAELMQLTRTLVELDTKNRSLIYKVIDTESTLINAVGKKADSYLKGVFTKIPQYAFFKNLQTAYGSLYSNSKYVSPTVRKWVNKWRGYEYGFIQQLVDEITGGSPSAKNIYDLANTRTQLIDMPRNNLIQAHLAFLNKQYSRPLTAKEKVTIFKGWIRPDLSSLLSKFTTPIIGKLLLDTKYREQEIQRIHTELKNLAGNQGIFNYYIESSQALGNYLITKLGTKGASNIYNILSIAELKNTPFENKANTETLPNIVELLDHLSSLYAISNMAETDRTNAASLIAEDAQAAESILLTHHSIQQESKQQLFDKNPYAVMKGYSKVILNPYTDIVVIDEENKQKYLDRDYYIVPKPLAIDQADTLKRPQQYLAIGKNKARGANLQHGVFSIIQNKHKGTKLSDINSGTFTVAEHGRIVQAKQAEYQQAFTNSSPRNLKAEAGVLIPLLDNTGKISTYRYEMSNHVQETFGEQTLGFDQVLGATAGQIVEKTESTPLNKQVLQSLREVYLNDKDLFPNAYVAIGPLSGLKGNEKLAEFYRSLPEETRKDITKVWGDSTMYVKKEMLPILFGEHKYSLMDAFDKPTEELHFLEKATLFIFKTLFKNKAYSRLNTLSHNIPSMVKMTKTNIIARNPDITIDNFVSNIMYLRMRGVENSFILDNLKVAVKYGLEYQADKLATTELELEINTLQKTATPNTAKLKKLLTQKVTLEDNMYHNPLREFIESGGLPDIIDDYNTNIENETKYETQFEEKLSSIQERIKDRGPKAEKVLKRLFLTQDTEEFQILNNAVKMTDFVARYVLYQHYTQESLGDAKKSHNDAMRAVLNEYVNFNIPTHRMIQWSNDVGLWWFSKYQLRILKPIIQSFMDKPTVTSYNILLASMFKISNIYNSIPGVTKGLFQNFSNPFTTFPESIPGFATLRPFTTAGDIIK